MQGLFFSKNIFRSNKYDFFPVGLLLTNHETLYNLNILPWASAHLLSQSLPFLQLQVCDHNLIRIPDDRFG